MSADNDSRKRQRETRPTKEEFMVEARKIWLRKNPYHPMSAFTEDRDFREFFGGPVESVLALWNLLVITDNLPAKGEIQHLLWTLMWMKIYAKRKTMATLCGGISKDTMEKWVFSFIDAIVYLEPNVIIFDNRFKGDKGADCLMSIDGIDCRCPNYGPIFSSHKFAKKGGLRYEVGLCIQTGDIVWINGPYPAGRYNDIKIFRESLLSELGNGERVEADDGYVGEAPQYVKCPMSFANRQETLFMQQRVRNRQETVNKRFKDWKVLDVRFRHELVLHGDAFRCIAIMIQLTINTGETLFECGYRDPPYDNTTNADNNDMDDSSDEEL